MMKQEDAFYDRSPATLFLLDRDRNHFADFPRGTLSVNPADGSWDASAGSRACIYTLAPGQALFSETTVYVEATVVNPSLPMQRSDVKNVWTVRLQGLGEASSAGIIGYETPSVPFSVPAEDVSGGMWAENAAVLGTLGRVLLQPADFTIGAKNVLQIFFTTAQGVPAGGAVVVDAPNGFACTWGSQFTALRVELCQNMANCWSNTASVPQLWPMFGRHMVVVGPHLAHFGPFWLTSSNNVGRIWA